MKCIRVNGETAERALGDFVCAGSVLIKSQGISVLENMHGNRIADLKIMDTGYLEAEMAHKAGARFVTASALAEENTIKRALECSADRGIEIIGDLLHKEARRGRLAEIGVKNFISGNKLVLGEEEIRIEELHKPVEGSVRTKAVEVKGPKLQIALDLLSTEKAVGIAERALAGGVDWIEAGTPLIKQEGMKAVRVLRNEFRDAIIVADMKTLERGRDETILACKNGADIVGICGSASDEVIRDAVSTGAVIMADLIAAEDPAGRARELEKLGVSMLEFHLAIDAQGGEYPFEILKKVCKTVSIPVGCAGGMNAEKVGSALDCGASFIVAGGSLTKADDPEKEAKRIKNAMVKN